MVGLLVAAMALAAGPAELPQTYCQLITPSGATATFRRTADAMSGPSRRFGFSGADVNLRLVVAQPDASGHRAVELVPTEGQGAGLPIALGYCSEGEMPTAAISPAGAAFEPTAWPNHCFIMARDGRRSTFSYRHEGGDSVFEPRDNVIWSGVQRSRRISPPAAPATGDVALGFATMNGDAGPNARENSFTNDRIRTGVVLFRFHSLRSANAPADDTGVAICGGRW